MGKFDSLMESTPEIHTQHPGTTLRQKSQVVNFTRLIASKRLVMVEFTHCGDRLSMVQYTFIKSLEFECDI